MHGFSARIGILGFSAGGHVAATVSTTTPSQEETLIKAGDELEQCSARPDFAWLIYPVISMAEPIAESSSKAALLLPGGGGGSPDDVASRAVAVTNQEMIHRYSAAEHVSRNTPPTFLAHAVDDHAVPIANSREYVAALRACDVSVELLELPSGGHGLKPMPMDGGVAPLWQRWQTAALAWTKTQLDLA